MSATLHKLPKPTTSKPVSFVLTDAGCHPPDEILFLAVCKYLHNDGAAFVTDDLIVRLIWECSGVETSEWNEEAFLAECQRLYRLTKSARPRKRDLFARVVVQLIRDLMAGLVLTEVANQTTLDV